MVGSNLGEEFGGEVGASFGGDVVEQFEVGVCFVAELGVCQFVVSVFAAEEAFLVDVHVSVAVVVQNYEAVHDCQHQLDHLLLGEGQAGSLPLLECRLQRALQVFQIEGGAIVLAADLSGLPGLDFTYLDEVLADSPAACAFSSP